MCKVQTVGSTMSSDGGPFHSNKSTSNVAGNLVSVYSCSHHIEHARNEILNTFRIWCRLCFNVFHALKNAYMSILSFLSFHLEGISLDELCLALGANAMVSRELLQLTLSGHL